MFESAKEIIEILNENEFEAFFVGGSIRNKIHNKVHYENIPVKDFDIVTNASFEEISNLFNNVSERGEQFKVAVVLHNGFEFEVAQYRGESYPSGGSLRPNKVYNVETLEEDIMRRDFTINGITEKADGEIIDYVDGINDIKRRVIRTIGDPNERFNEDPLRILRAFRFASQLGYSFDVKTTKAIKRNIHLISDIPHERVKLEINKMLLGDHVVETLKKMKHMNVDKIVFKNSLENKHITLLENFFSLPIEYFKKTLYQLEELKKRNPSLCEIYYIIYKFVEPTKVVKELNDMGFLNKKEIQRVFYLLKNYPIVSMQTSIMLYKMVIDIKEQEGKKALIEMINSYKNIYPNVDFSELDNLLDRPLFKSELPFSGEDIIQTGKELGIKEEGPWIGEVLDLIQYHSIMGANYNISDLISACK